MNSKVQLHLMRSCRNSDSNLTDYLPCKLSAQGQPLRLMFWYLSVHIIYIICIIMYLFIYTLYINVWLSTSQTLHNHLAYFYITHTVAASFVEFFLYLHLQDLDAISEADEEAKKGAAKANRC